MKLKSILNYILIAILAIQLVSCDNKETIESPFGATPTERLTAKQKELNDLLESSEFGWKAVYFTDVTQLGGFTHVFKFKDGKVDMASDFDDDTAIYSSEYSIELGSTTSLLFSTSNRIHLLSDSNNAPTAALRGKGYKGDFQFLYYGQENGEIIFRTNRSFEELRFVKATAADWTNLAKARAIIPNVIGASSRPLFRLLETNDGTKIDQFDFTFTPASRYAVANSIVAGSSFSYNVGVAYTATGITVQPAVKVGTQELTDFTYDATTGSFTATGTGGVTATIRYSNKPLVITDDYLALLDGNPSTAFGYITRFLSAAPTNSDITKSLIAEINANLPAGIALDRVQFQFNTAFGSYIVYTFTGGKSAEFHNLQVIEDSVNKTIIFQDLGWDSGSTPAVLAKIDAELLNPKGLYVKRESFQFGGPPNTIYTFTSAASNFRITTYAFQ